VGVDNIRPETPKKPIQFNARHNVLQKMNLPNKFRQGYDLDPGIFSKLEVSSYALIFKVGHRRLKAKSFDQDHVIPSFVQTHDSEVRTLGRAPFVKARYHMAYC